MDKLGKEDGKTGGGGYGSIVCSVSMSNKSCSEYVKVYNDDYSSTCVMNPDGCNNILTAVCTTYPQLYISGLFSPLLC
jgi:hypothetical protein